MTQLKTWSSTRADVEKMWKATLKRMQELGSEDFLVLNISRAWPEEIPE